MIFFLFSLLLQQSVFRHSSFVADSQWTRPQACLNIISFWGSCSVYRTFMDVSVLDGVNGQLFHYCRAGD